MTFYILLTAVSISMILMNFKLPNFKPFTCPSCLASWIAFVLLLIFEPSMWFAFPTAYLLTSIFLIYETK